MKKIFTMCALAVAAIACQKQAAFAPSELVEVSLTVGVPTKTVMDADGGMFWTNSDDLSVFTDTDEVDQNTNYQFTVQSLSDDAKCAVFASDVTANSERTTFYAIYPYAASRKDNALTAKRVEVPYNGGELNGDYVSTRFIMAGKGSVSGNDFTHATTQMQHLTWIWDITINNPDAKAIAAVQLSAAESIFPCAGNIDLTSDDIAVTPTFYRNALQYNFSKPQSGETVLARFPIFPMEAKADVELNVVVKFEDGTKETFARKAPAKATEAGKRYHNTYTLGQGVYDDMPEGYVLVKNGDDLRAKLNSQMNSESVKEVKIYLESSSTEALSYSLGGSRINPTKSVYIRSNPANVRPIVSANAGATFEITTADLTGLTFSFKNIELQAASSSNADFFQISNNGVSVDLFEIDNCVFKTYKHSLIRTSGNNVPSGVSFSGASLASVKINNSIFRMKAPGDGGKAFFYFQKQGDNINKVSVTNSTFENVLYFYQNQMVQASGKVDVDIHNNTFVNTAGVVQNGRTYFVRFVNGVRGTIDLTGNLFGGSNNVATIGLLGANLVTATYSDNYATSDWRSTFTNYEGTTDIVTVTGTNAEVFSNLANFDLTLKPGTAAYGANAGDPRWLPTSSAGLGDLEIEDTEY